MLRRKLLEIGAMMALGVNYATAYVIAFVWDWPTPDSELYIHILMMFVVSLLFAALIVDMKKTLFYTIGSIVIGISLATAVISAPSMTLPEAIRLLDFDITLALTSISRLFLIGITFMILGAIVGCFVGDAVSE